MPSSLVMNSAQRAKLLAESSTENTAGSEMIGAQPFEIMHAPFLKRAGRAAGGL